MYCIVLLYKHFQRIVNIWLWDNVGVYGFRFLSVVAAAEAAAASAEAAAASATAVAVAHGISRQPHVTMDKACDPVSYD